MTKGYTYLFATKEYNKYKNIVFVLLLCIQELFAKFFYVLQLPFTVPDSEIAALIHLFSPFTLETVALQYLGVTEAEIGTFKAKRRDDADGLKRELLYIFRNRGNSRKVRILKLTESKEKDCSAYPH